MTKPDGTNERDDAALELRSSGSSFARIARSLGFSSARDANHAFQRALRRKPAKERKAIRTAETARLDDLERTVRADGELDDPTRAKKLKTIDRLRARLLDD